MKFTPIPENNEELHLPQLVYCASLKKECRKIKQLLNKKQFDNGKLSRKQSNATTINDIKTKI